jgi:predicted ATPase
MQWAGQDALDLLLSLARAVAGTRVRIVAAYRETELHGGSPLAETRADLVYNGLATSLTLGPLAASETQELVKSVAARHSITDAVTLLRRTGGVPFFLVHCAQDTLTDDPARGSTDAMLWSVTQSVRQRVTSDRSSAATAASTGSARH